MLNDKHLFLQGTKTVPQLLKFTSENLQNLITVNSTGNYVKALPAVILPIISSFPNFTSITKAVCSFVRRKLPGINTSYSNELSAE